MRDRNATSAMLDQMTRLFLLHLEICFRCASQPFNLCPSGEKLIRRVGEQLKIFHGANDVEASQQSQENKRSS
ncbi:MAG: hypothetical protein V7638_3858 [Acidobacteriota bacterium]